MNNLYLILIGFILSSTCLPIQNFAETDTTAIVYAVVNSDTIGAYKADSEAGRILIELSKLDTSLASDIKQIVKEAPIGKDSPFSIRDLLSYIIELFVAGVATSLLTRVKDSIIIIKQLFKGFDPRDAVDIAALLVSAILEYVLSGSNFNLLNWIAYAVVCKVTAVFLYEKLLKDFLGKTPK